MKKKMAIIAVLVIAYQQDSDDNERQIFRGNTKKGVYKGRCYIYNNKCMENIANSIRPAKGRVENRK